MSKFLKLIFAFLLLAVVYPAGGQTHSVTLILSERVGAYQQFAEALSKKLAARHVVISIQDSESPIMRGDLLIAVGMKAVTAVFENAQDPVLSVLVPKDGYMQVLASPASRRSVAAKNTTAIFLDQPVQRQFEFIRALLPKIRSVGLLYSASPKDISQMRGLAKTRGFELVEQSVESAAMLPSALRDVLVSSDVLLALPDAEIYNSSTIRNILLATYRNRVPLLGFSSAYVKAGALAAIYSSPEQVAEQADSIVQNYLATQALPAAQYPREFEISINEQVARSLGISFRSEAQLRQELGRSQ